MNRSTLAVAGQLLAAFGLVYYFLAQHHQYAQFLPWTPEEKKAPKAEAPAAATPAPPKAKSAPVRAPSGPGWAVNCSSNAGERGLTCRLSQTVVLKETGRTLTNVAFVFPSENKNPEVQIQLPLGLSVPAGASYQVDANAPQRLSIRVCDKNGCYAQASVSPETMGALRTGKQLKVAFTDLSEKPISLALSLEGFASSYEKTQTP